MVEFKATHTITFTPVTGDPVVYEVQLEAGDDGFGPAYTRAEWESCGPADWEYTESGWLCQGQAAPGGANGRVRVTDPIVDET